MIYRFSCRGYVFQYNSNYCDTLYLSDETVKVIGQSINREVGLGLQITADYIFLVNSRAITWIKRSINKIMEITNAKIQK